MGNEMRWDCEHEKYGCYLKKSVLKFNVFDKCFAGDARMTDIDGFIERKRRFLYQEWKHGAAKIDKGQHIAFKKLTYDGDSVLFLVNGAPETMVVDSIEVYVNGWKYGPVRTELEVLKALCSQWWRVVDTKMERYDDYRAWLARLFTDRAGLELTLDDVRKTRRKEQTNEEWYEGLDAAKAAADTAQKDT